jgi:hypothetical protein
MTCVELNAHTKFRKSPHTRSGCSRVTAVDPGNSEQGTRHMAKNALPVTKESIQSTVLPEHSNATQAQYSLSKNQRDSAQLEPFPLIEELPRTIADFDSGMRRNDVRINNVVGVIHVLVAICANRWRAGGSGRRTGCCEAGEDSLTTTVERILYEQPGALFQANGRKTPLILFTQIDLCVRLNTFRVSSRCLCCKRR